MEPRPPAHRAYTPVGAEEKPILVKTILFMQGFHVITQQDREVSFFGRKYYASFHGVQITLSILPGGCPRIVIFSQIEECEKNYRRYIVDIPRIIF